MHGTLTDTTTRDKSGPMSNSNEGKSTLPIYPELGLRHQIWFSLILRKPSFVAGLIFLQEI